MIERYQSEDLKEIFSLKHRYSTFLKIEIAVCKVYSQHGVIPKKDYELIKNNAKFDVERINELEKITKHDVVAFTRNVSESLGEEKKWIHYSLTSTDIVDTALGLIYKNSNDILKKSLDRLIDSLKKKALQYENTPIIGRTHGIHAEVTSFGLKWALYYDMLNKNKKRFLDACRAIEKCKLSGAVGNFANIPSYVQDEVAKELGLESAKISTQVLSRDDHAYYLSILCLIGSICEQIATEIRLLSQSEIHEAEEEFSKFQKGSSAMPHKRNPVASENIVGCARILRGYALTSFEDIALWHERDISHSSVERVIFPDAISLLNYMLTRLANVVDNLFVNEDKMLENIYLTQGVVFSQRVLSKLIEKGSSRESAYDEVQKIAMKALNEKKMFKDLLLESNFVTTLLNNEEINECFKLDYYLKNTHEIYSRIGLLDIK